MYYPTTALDMLYELSKDRDNSNFKALADSVTLKGKTHSQSTLTAELLD